MMNKMSTYLLLTFFCVFLLNSSIISENKEKKDNSNVNKTTGTPVRTYFNINNISSQFYNDGNSDIDPSGNSGLIFPRGSGKGAVFESGLIWGARVTGDPQVRVGGSTYRQGLQPGKIISPGNAESPDLPKNRIYRVRPDVYPGGPAVDLSVEVNDEGSNQASVRAQYELDWTEWPAADGAPFTDNNGNGTYEPASDIPGVPGADQTIWFVANDLDPGKTSFIYGTQPLGIEMQATIWGYSQTGALGNMFFRKYRLINKSNITFNDMYVSMWSDVDLGNSTEDFAGCDTLLSLGYCYNGQASDATYSPLPPPAIGFDFFQGPVVQGEPTDSAIFNGQVVYGMKNLPMTAFYYFTRGDATVTDPTLGDPQGATQFYNFMRGRVGLTGNLFVDPNTGQTTTFALSGDPQTRQGWIDGQLQPPGDRRIGLASGPFNMVPGDTQEVVVAEIAAGAIPGVDRISAIGLLKFFDEQAQSAYDNFFDLPVPPPQPEVNVVELDNQIVLDWGENNNLVLTTENFNSKGYQFQGYNIYQLPSASSDLSQAVRIATYDIVDGIGKIEEREFDATTGVVAVRVQQFGNDTGLKRYITIRNDAVRGGVPLVNGIRYYFAVTSYSFNPDAVPNNLENPIRVLTIVPKSLNPGVRYEFSHSDTVTVTRTSGASDGNVYPVVVDPNKLTGLDYTVTFDTMTVFNEVDSVYEVLTVWNLDRSDGQRLLSNQSNQAADDLSPIVDGLQIKVIGAPLDFKGFDMLSNAAGPVPETIGFDVTKPPTDVNAYSADWYRDVLTGNASILDLDAMTNGGFYFIVAGGPNIADHQSAVGRITRGGGNFGLLIPNNYEIRFTERGSKAWMAFSTGTVVDVPFEIWYLGPNFGDPSDDIRMMPWIFDDNENDVFDFKLDHEASGANNDPYSDWIYFMMPEENAQPGEAAYDAAVARTNPSYDGAFEIEHLARVVLMNWNQIAGGGAENALPETGTTFRIRMTVPNKAGDDAFTFRAPAPTLNTELAKQDAELINVFPNPYYGVNPEELNKYNRFVTFSHLPQKATIRIFNLAGVLVKSLNKDDASQFLRWDLANQAGLPIASGLYIAHIEMPDLGTTKILKLAIIQEEQILDRF